ncbi:MarR family winged helix-turn-helix transcriptional regulator [Oceaniglobus roseus]|uniref:MarR family winged helix-turn-helix transcriptional regulator n=1 Tax=Oceaniglobus roseus TaxID=1737570 RepID=UPI001300132B|nr:MarR family transcriptional regulator [Kandeliimicrobium roseum]
MSGSRDDRDGVETMERILSYRIARLHQSLSVQATNILAQYGVSLSNWRVLSAIWVEQTRTSRELAEKSGFDPAQISRALHAMAKQGLLTLANSETDRRVLTIEITDEGNRLFSDALPIMKARHDALRGALGPEELETLFVILDKLEAVAQCDPDLLRQQPTE